MYHWKWTKKANSATVPKPAWTGKNVIPAGEDHNQPTEEIHWLKIREAEHGTISTRSEGIIQPVE